MSSCPPWRQRQYLDNSTARDSDPANRPRMGMIGFDIVCVTVRSGSRMHGYLVNDPCEKISANNKSTVSAKADFALAA
jgi:hypothetical protein